MTVKTPVSASKDESDVESNVADSCTETKKMERVYVGGLNPPYLTVSEFRQRLEESLGSVVEILDDDNNEKKMDDEMARYVHFNVQLKGNSNNTNKDNKSALEHIAKLYHNVTWKGCKLRVQAAKPHFLDRLQQEIQERNALSHPHHKQDTTEATPNPNLENVDQSQSLPGLRRRHLKVRKRHGEQVFSVDTKPYAVTSWNEMQTLLRKIERRKRHYVQQQLELKQHPQQQPQQHKHPNPQASNIRTQSKLNRAVHLRFSNTATSSGHEEPCQQSFKNHKTKEQGDSSTSSASLDSDDGDDDSSLASSSSSLDNNVDNGISATTTSRNLSSAHNDDPQRKKSKYEWSSSSSSSSSDDKDDDDASESDSNKHQKDKKEQTIKLQSSKAEKNLQDDTSSSASYTASSIGEETTSIELDNSKCTTKVNEYNNGYPTNESKKTPKFPSELDEFESAMEIDKMDNHMEPNNQYDSDASSSPYVAEDEDDGDKTENLQKDVESNLNVLASIFPDLKQTKPRKVATDIADASEPEAGPTSLSSSAGRKGGWTAGGIMVRYDPTKDLSPPPATTTENDTTKESISNDNNQNDEPDEKTLSDDESEEENNQIQKEEKKESDDSASDNSTSNGDTSEPEKENHVKDNDITENTGSAVGNIYKQDKLEHLFREAREAAITSEPIVVRQDSAAQAVVKPGSFAFGFDLGTEDDKTETKTQPIAPTTANNSGGFSFSFFPAPEEKDDSKDTNNNAKVAVQSVEAEKYSSAAIAGDDEKQTQSKGFRRRGMTFPRAVLDKYQEDFYVMNDGLKILQDLERYRYDDEVKEHWKQERQTLTQDWKRKRKYAQQARNKHQKHPRLHNRR